MPMVAWYMLSKESYMKRVIRDVLPTVMMSERLVWGGGWKSELRCRSYHFARLRRPVCRSGALELFAPVKDRQAGKAYLNFFRGFE